MFEIPAESCPWGDQEWRERALAWVGAQVQVVGADEPRLRPWSITMRLRTDVGPMWFKANPPGSAFEGPLARALGEWVPRQVLAPLAIDADEGWSLLPDGGVIMRDASADLDDWEALLRQYAELQRAVAPHVDELVRIGVPDLRPDRLPARFADLVALEPVAAGLTAEQHAMLSSAGPQLADWCAQLAASPVPAMVDHSDLHEGQVFVADDGRFVFFDWGDASIGHPFTSLLVALRVVAERFGPDALDRLRDAYLEPWTAESSAAELRATVEVATRLGVIGRALTWLRVFPAAEDAVRAKHGGIAASWLLMMLTPSLLRATS